MPRYPVGFGESRSLYPKCEAKKLTETLPADSWFGRFLRWFTPDRIYDAVVVQGIKAGGLLPEEIVDGM
jgi:hypothetical protein